MEKTMSEVLAKAREAKKQKAHDRERYLTALECLEERVIATRFPDSPKYDNVRSTLKAIKNIRAELGGKR